MGHFDPPPIHSTPPPPFGGTWSPSGVLQPPSTRGRRLGGFNGMQSDHCGLLGSLIGGEGHRVTWRPLWGSRTPPRPPTIPPPPLGGTRSPLAYCSLRPPEGALCAPLRDAEEPLGSFGVADDFEITPDPRLGSAMGTSHCHCHRVDVGLPMGRPQGSYGALHGAMGQLWDTVGCYGAL